jgi:ribosome-binding factor A
MMKRSSRVGDLLQREISEIILRELQDPRIGFVTVTGVAMSDDLKYAKVYISVMGSSEMTERTFVGLNSARRYIQTCIGKRVKLRYIPEISFHLDSSISYGAHIDKLLRDLHTQESDETE